MLKGIESIASEYLYHCEIVYVKNGGYIKSIWTADKLIGKRYYYNRCDILLGFLYYNIQNKNGKKFEYISERVNIDDRYERLTKRNKYPRNTIITVDFGCDHISHSRVMIYKNNKHHYNIVWDLTGKQIIHTLYPDQCNCLIL